MKHNPRLITIHLFLFCLFLINIAIAANSTERGPVRPSRDPGGDRALFIHDGGNVRMTISNWGEFGNPDADPGYFGFEFPQGSETNFLFAAGIWVGAIVDDERLVSTTTDGDNGTNEFSPTRDNFIYQSDVLDEEPYILSRKGIDDDADWDVDSDDLDGNGRPSSNWDGGSGIIGVDDDNDGEIDEEEADGQDDDGDDLIDEDTDETGDANGDGDCGYDPEPHIDEDPPGNMADDLIDNDFDGLIDGDDEDFDGDADPRRDDDDGDGAADEDGAAMAKQHITAFYDDTDSDEVRNPDQDGHTPLDIMIEQRSFCWLMRNWISNVVVFETIIRNIGDEPLSDVFIGIFADPDICAEREAGDEAMLDDWNFFDYEYLMAIQGDDTTDHDGYGPGVFAVKLLGLSRPVDQMNISFKNFERQAGGDPENNVDKYNFISDDAENNDEPTAEPGDWRFLIGLGPDEGGWFPGDDSNVLLPGQAIEIAFTFIGASDVRSAVQTAQWANYYRNLHFLREHEPGDWFPDPMRPRVADVGDGESVTVSWPTYVQIPELEGVILYYGDLEEVAEEIDAEGENRLVIDGLTEGVRYYFAVRIYDDDGDESEVSDSTWITPLSIPRKPAGLWIVEEGFHTIDIGWQPNPCAELDLVGYNLYRSADGSDFSRLNQDPIAGITFHDQLDEYAVYTYHLTAVDEDGNESEAYGADSLDVPTEGAPFIMDDWRVLLIDETRDGNGRPGSPNDRQADDFYRNILQDYRYVDFDYREFNNAARRTLGAREIGKYRNIIWHSDDKSQLLFGENQYVLDRFFQYEGKIILSGWDILSNFSDDNEVGFSEGSLPREHLDIAGGRRSLEMEFIGAIGLNGYPDLQLDRDKIPERWEGLDRCWQMNPVEGDVIYTFISSNENSDFHGTPCAVRCVNDQGSTIVLGFPLYFMEEEGATGFMQRALNDLQVGIREEADLSHPLEFRLEANYPNPFNSVTTIRYVTPYPSQVSLRIYNPLGQRIITLFEGYKQVGVYLVDLNAGGLPSGLYFVKLECTGQTLTRKLVLIR